jgi:hypothetical protein
MKIYRVAAALIVGQYVNYACDAVKIVTYGMGTDMRDKFREFFIPDPANPHQGLWWGEINEENQLARSLGLLLMQEIYDEME